MTVAVPTMNGARHLADTLQSIVAQGLAVTEILISDDRSEDDTLGIVTDVLGDRARVSINGERLGLAGNWNRCLDLASTSLIAIVHQDDVLREGHLAAHISMFSNHADVGIVASASDVIDEQGHAVPESVVGRGGLGSVDAIFGPGEACPQMAAANPLRCSSVSLRVAVAKDVGTFDQTLKYVVDWEYWLRIARRWSLAWLAKPTVDVRWHAGSETHRLRNGVVDLEETERLVEQNLQWLASQNHSTTILGRTARRALARAYLNRAHGSLRSGNGRLGRSCLFKGLSRHGPESSENWP